MRDLARVADELSDGLAVVRGGCIMWANRRLADWTGRPADALRGCAPDSLVAPGEPALTHEGETRLEGAGGRRIPVRALRLSEGDGGDATWVFRDLARASGLEGEVLALGRALREANLELEALRERGRRQRADLDELLTVVSHELRTPVTVVSGYARLLLSEQVGELNDEQRGFLEESLKSCRRLDSFIANLLVDSRDARADAPLQVREAPLDATLFGVVQSLKPLLDEHGASPTVAVQPGTPPARFDPVRIEQVLTNLLENAIKYGGPRGTIEIACRPAAGPGRPFVEVSVSDDGPGVPEADRERIFDRYVRAGERRGAGGLGLGLAICRRVVVAHGGVMGVTDSEAQGARFWFTLPAALPSPDERAADADAEARES